MENYQTFWNLEIKNLLQDLDAPESLHLNIVDTLQNSGRSGIYENQIINALRLAISFKENNLNIAFVSSMQSGKSKTIYFLCNYVLPAIGFIDAFENILFVTSMRDTDLYNQNSRNLESDYYDASCKKTKNSKIKVMKMSDFFNSPNPQKVVKDYNVKLVVRDEDQYGCGEESSFQFAFFDELRKRIPGMHLLAVSATPYDILDAHFRKNADIDVVEGIRPPTYYGISEMLNDDIIDDLPLDFHPLQDNGDGYEIHPYVISYVEHLLNFSDGLGIVRESSTIRAVELRYLLTEKFANFCEVILIGSDSSCNHNINDGMNEVSNLVLKRGKRVILIVVQALSAGKDLGNLKSKVRFGIETRDRQLANGAQGITGRCCGYHTNRDIKIMANKTLLEHYAKFEQDWEIFSNSIWREELFDNSIKGLTTQTRFNITQKEGKFTSIDDIYEISESKLFTDEGRSLLSFLNNESYDKVFCFFQPEFFENGSKGTKLGAKDVTVRIASSYKKDDNRVYNSWDASMKEDFGSIFFKKNSYNYGLLISNYPKEDIRNHTGFTGIKVFVVGKTEMRERITDIENKSMYVSQ